MKTRKRVEPRSISSWQICTECGEEFWGTHRKKVCDECQKKGNRDKYKDCEIVL